METKRLKRKRDYLAPDKSEIRLLVKINRGNMWHCTLPADSISRPVCHKTVDEIWYVISGQGKVWRSFQNKTSIVSVKEGTCLSILAGTKFQFRSEKSHDLKFIGVTVPPWPGTEEAYKVQGKWGT
jgi:mannose-6-phosphate isomerase-like protein (cupin superfamily)